MSLYPQPHMCMKLPFPTLLATLLLVLTEPSHLWAQNEPDGNKKVGLPAEVIRRNAALQQHFFRFQSFDTGPLDRKPRIQTITLNRDPLLIEGARYDGFRFTVNHGAVAVGAAAPDLVWAFVPPLNYRFWYIVPKNGDMRGFERFFRVERSQLPDFGGREPWEASRVFLQMLPGDYLEDGQEYLIWFQFRDDKAAEMSMMLGFAHVENPDRSSIAEALGLRQQ